MSGHDDITDRTADMMQLQDVHRWAVVKTGRPQSVAEHSFNVLVIVWELLERLNLADDPVFVARSLIWGIAHDGPEVYTGDVDGKFKRDFPDVREAIVGAENKAFKWYRELSRATPVRVNAVVKLADKIEAITFIQQWGVGGRADDVLRELQWIMENETLPKAAVQIGVEEGKLRAVVKHITDHSVSESNCIQMRRHRKEEAR